MLELAITGAAGRMGQRLITLAKQDGGFHLVGAVERPEHPAQGNDAGEVAGAGKLGLPVTFDLKQTPKVLIDFTHPVGLRHWLKVCRDRNIALVIGTTGLQPADHASIDQAAAEIPIVQSPNMSLGVNLLFKVAGEMARLLGDDYDIEITEAHHRFKKDAPSGTAMGLAEAILKATGKPKEALVYGRAGDDCVRQRGDIGIHSMRMGDEVGKHTVHFGALGERIELTHTATNRDTFALGALRAAKWLAEQNPGRYTVQDVLGIK